jgi:hypothetical protein
MSSEAAYASWVATLPAALSRNGGQKRAFDCNRNEDGWMA